MIITRTGLLLIVGEEVGMLFEILKKNQVRILIPNVIENFFFSTTKPKVKYYNALAKSALSLGAHFVAREKGIKDMDKEGISVYNP